MRISYLPIGYFDKDKSAYGRIEYKTPSENDQAFAVFDELKDRGWDVDEDFEESGGWCDGVVRLDLPEDFGELYKDYREAKRHVCASRRICRGSFRY